MGTQGKKTEDNIKIKVEYKMKKPYFHYKGIHLVQSFYLGYKHVQRDTTGNLWCRSQMLVIIHVTHKCVTPQDKDVQRTRETGLVLRVKSGDVLKLDTNHWMKRKLKRKPGKSAYMLLLNFEQVHFRVCLGINQHCLKFKENQRLQDNLLSLLRKE